MNYLKCTVLLGALVLSFYGSMSVAMDMQEETATEASPFSPKKIQPLTVQHLGVGNKSSCLGTTAYILGTSVIIVGGTYAALYSLTDYMTTVIAGPFVSLGATASVSSAYIGYEYLKSKSDLSKIKSMSDDEDIEAQL